MVWLCSQLEIEILHWSRRLTWFDLKAPLLCTFSFPKSRPSDNAFLFPRPQPWPIAKSKISSARGSPVANRQLWSSPQRDWKRSHHAKNESAVNSAINNVDLGLRYIKKGEEFRLSMHSIRCSSLRIHQISTPWLILACCMHSACNSLMLKRHVIPHGPCDGTTNPIRKMPSEDMDRKIPWRNG